MARCAHARIIDARTPRLEWRVDAARRRDLRREGFEVLDFAEVRRVFIEPSRAPTRKPSLVSPAQRLFDLLGESTRVAVTEVVTATPGDLHDVYGYLVEPAWRRGVYLRIYADQALDDLNPERLTDELLGYPWTLERLRYIAARTEHREFETGLPPLTPIEYRLLQAMRTKGLSPVAQFGVGRYRVDFAFPALQLAVEADGREWHDAVRDRKRDQTLEAYGWSVLRFTGSEIVREAEACANAIAARCVELRGEPRNAQAPPTATKPGWFSRLCQWIRRRLRLATPRPPIDLHTTEDDESPENSWLRDLDPTQRAAVLSHDGVVQVLAPAGSGKTRVLVARVQELISRGVPPNRILCCTFNRAAKDELRGRLTAEGVDHVVVLSFHGVGWKILKEHGLLRDKVGSLNLPQWRRLAREAKNAVAGSRGVWIEADAAAEAISRFKLEDLMSPDEVGRTVSANPTATPLDHTAAKLYVLYERHLEEHNQLDFDDLILCSLRLLMEDAAARRKWQRQFICVLVDEYQDIEPAQERLVQMLAAPHDSLFCVGDEDQCIYAWRRADVERILELDRHYPALERHALEINYRCPAEVTAGSRFMIEENTQRFPKPIHPMEPAKPGKIEIAAFAPHANLAAHTGELLCGADPRATVVLARTRQLLRDVAVECARHGVPFRAGDFILDRSGPNRTLIAYLRLFSDLSQARTEDVSQVFRVPNRYLPDAAAPQLATRLQTGFRFPEAVKGLGNGDIWRQRELDKAGVLFAKLTTIESASEFIQTIRSEGGVDAYYALAQKLDQHDQSSIDALDNAELRAAGKTVSQAADLYSEETDLIRQFRCDDGVELSTIHGAKGREWSWVVLVHADANMLPHQTSLGSAPDAASKASVLEDERRLAYVALTRTTSRLTILHHDPLSPFVVEAARGFESASRRRLGFDVSVPADMGGVLRGPGQGRLPD